MPLKSDRLASNPYFRYTVLYVAKHRNAVLEIIVSICLLVIFYAINFNETNPEREIENAHTCTVIITL